MNQALKYLGIKNVNHVFITEKPRRNGQEVSSSLDEALFMFMFSLDSHKELPTGTTSRAESQKVFQPPKEHLKSFKHQLHPQSCLKMLMRMTSFVESTGTC